MSKAICISRDTKEVGKLSIGAKYDILIENDNDLLIINDTMTTEWYLKEKFNIS